MRSMWKVAVVVIAVLLALAFVVAYAQKEKVGTPVESKAAEASKMGPAAHLARSVERGKALFNDAGLGTSGMTCSSCHMNGGTADGKMEGMTTKAFDALSTKFPKFWPMADRVMTLDQAVNFCVVNPLKGTALAWDSQELTDLVAYCASVMPAKEMPKPTEK